jgi:hypothetical protein
MTLRNWSHSYSGCTRSSYRHGYRIDNEQIDGSFRYQSFDYLVEARWRAQPASESDLVALQRKVDKKLDSTRGIFISMAGFVPEAVSQFVRNAPANVILIDGQDLALILEGYFPDRSLDLKIQKGAQEGKYRKVSQSVSASSLISKHVSEMMSLSRHTTVREDSS